MPVLKAFALPHPPLAIPGIGKGQEKQIPKTLVSYEQAAIEISALAPDTVIYITPHGTLYEDYFHISPGGWAQGDFSRFGAANVRLETDYDEQLAAEISDMAENSGLPAGTQGGREAKLDHGTTVPMWFINKHYSNYKALRISQSGMGAAQHYKLGRIITEACDACGRRAVVIGSSDLSHRLRSDGPYGYAPEGPEFDRMVTEALGKGDFTALFNIPEKLREKAGECGYNSLMVLAGLFDLQSVKAELMSYEAPFGVGYAAAAFTALGPDSSRNILEQYLDSAAKAAIRAMNSEDDYQNLARRSLEHIIKTGKKLPVPNGLPREMYDNKAGVFVSLHIGERLRGCIGTIMPSTKCIAEEIIQNAVSAGLSDTRFMPVTRDELDRIKYKVDVLSPPEKISSPDELDVKRYGVIVSSGYRRGLLLPNLDGVDTVEEQISIARSKAGISQDSPAELERFEVIRHE